MLTGKNSIKIVIVSDTISRSFENGRIFAMKGSRQVLVDLTWNSITSTKTGLEPSMAEIRPVTKLPSNNG